MTEPITRDMSDEELVDLEPSLTQGLVVPITDLETLRAVEALQNHPNSELVAWVTNQTKGSAIIPSRGFIKTRSTLNGFTADETDTVIDLMVTARQLVVVVIVGPGAPRHGLVWSEDLDEVRVPGTTRIVRPREANQ